MPKTKEDIKEYKRQYYLKNKDKIKEHYIKNKDEISIKRKDYFKTETYKKSNRISHWKHRGILCFDYNLLYDIFLSTNKCEFCNCELNKCSKSRKCLDHDHTITDKFNVRGVLCHSCNIKDILNKNL